MVRVLLNQIFIMAALMAVGYILVKRGIISRQGNSDLGKLLISVIIPRVVLKSYMVEFSREKLRLLGISALMALSAHILAMAVSWAVFGKKQRTYNFAAAFGNAGFMGIPLVSAVFGPDAVFLIAHFVAMLNFFQWTYGLYVMTGDRDKISVKSIAKNPVLIAAAVGIVLFILPISYPEILVKTVGYITDLNTPVAMIVLGGYLTEVNVKELFLSLENYKCALIRLVVIPFATLALFKILPIYEETTALAILIAGSVSTGGAIAVFAKEYGGDGKAAVNTVCLTTVLSLVTVPIFFRVRQKII